MIESYIRELGDLLERRGLLSELDESTIDEAKELPLVGNILQSLIPEHVLFQDSECIFQDEDLVTQVKEAARITQGDWHPTNIVAHIDWQDNRATIEFQSDGKMHKWEFDQCGDYISDGFFTSLHHHADENLSGSFFKYSSMGQEFCLFYLPEPVSIDFGELQDSFAPSSDEIAAFVTSADEWKEQGYTGWYLIREVLRETNMKHINEPTRDGKHVISILRELGEAGNDWAIELEAELIRLGAERYPGQ